MSNETSLNNLFTEFYSFVYDIKIRGIVRRYSVEELEKEIFNYNPYDAVKRLDLAIANAEELLYFPQSMNPPTDYNDAFKALFGKHPTAKTNVEQKVEMAIASMLEFEVVAPLNNLKYILHKGMDNVAVEQEKDDEKKTLLEFVICKEFDFPKAQKNHQTALSKDQTAILFHYLEDKNIILPFQTKSKARLIGAITGYSSNTLRSAFTYIDNVKKGLPETSEEDASKYKLDDIQKVKLALESIISEINHFIEINASRASTKKK